MASLPVYDQTGKQVGQYEIDPAELCGSIDKQLLHDAVVMYQANQRQGSFKTKTRSEVKGSTKKMYRQKGTGNARAGSKRSGIRRGGGHIFAKRPRDFSYRLPRKALQKATRMAMAGKIKDAQVMVLEDLSLAAPRTAEIAQLLKTLEIQGSSTLIATDAYNPTVYRSARNIPRVQVMEVRDLNALAILHPRRILITRAALDALKEGQHARGDDPHADASD
jgi:large subunit ribosomal protein L4